MHWLNILVKVLVIALSALVFFRYLPSFEGKAMEARFFFFTIGVLILPAIWLLKGRPKNYPHAADAILGIPLIIDGMGNATPAYSTWFFDDIVHFVSPLIFGFVFVGVFYAFSKSKALAWFATVGVLTSSHIIFEIMEAYGDSLDGMSLYTSLPDTLSDLGWGLLASVALLFIMNFSIKSGIGEKLAHFLAARLP